MKRFGVVRGTAAAAAASRFRARKFVLVLLVVAGLGGLAAIPAVASHEGNNALTFAPAAGSPSPAASGSGIVNLVAGRSTAEPGTVWTSSFHFAGLAAATTYTVVLFANNVAQPGTCTFTTNLNGHGGCTSTFATLDRFGMAQLRLGDDTGAPVLQATRQSTNSGPGTVVSRGDCRHPEQIRSLCEAPGRQ